MAAAGCTDVRAAAHLLQAAQFTTTRSILMSADVSPDGLRNREWHLMKSPEGQGQLIIFDDLGLTSKSFDAGVGSAASNGGEVSAIL